MGIVTIVAMVGLSLYWYPENESLVMVSYIVYYISVFFFVLEFLLKIVCFGPREYFRNGNNVLDFVLVIINILSIFSTLVLDIEFFDNLTG